MASNKLDELRKNATDHMLDAKELDAVAGGNAVESSYDSRFLNVLLRGHPAQCDRWGEYKFKVSTDNHSRYEQLRTAWKACGIRLDFVSNKKYNRYSSIATGEEVTRDEAWEIAMKNIGRHLNPSDWDW